MLKSSGVERAFSANETADIPPRNAGSQKRLRRRKEEAVTFNGYTFVRNPMSATDRAALGEVLTPLAS
jgi:hypothetical protein